MNNIPKYVNVQEAYSTLQYKFPTVTAKGVNFYEIALQKFQNMLSDKELSSLKKAVYLVENAFYENTLPYQNYDDLLKEMAFMIGLKMKENKSPQTDLSKNLAIYHFMADTFQVKLPNKANQVYTHYPFRYDFEDYRGQQDYRKMFVTKAMNSNAGQCHSLPLLYMLLAEEIGAKAWMSYSPNHTFIKFMVSGKLQNYETTNGHFTTDAFVFQSGYIKAEALAHRIYLDTLSKKALIAHCLMDLAMGYQYKYGYSDFVLKCADLTLQYAPNNVTALMIRANYYGTLMQYIAEQAKAKRLPNVDIEDIPQAHAIYQKVVSAHKILDEVGYAEMPEEAYQAWLRSVEKVASKQTYQNLKQNVQKQK